jgi:hypothetical protein
MHVKSLCIPVWIKRFQSGFKNHELMKYLYEISSSHGGEHDVQNCLLGCTAV